MSQIEVDKIIPQSGTDTQLGESGDTITIPAGATITNSGTANGFGSADTEKVKVSANDTTAGFLNGKLVAGTNITLTEGSDGGNETLTAALSGTITPSDNTVTLAKLTATGTKNSTTFLRGDNTFNAPPLGGITMADQWRRTAAMTITSTAQVLSANWEQVDTSGQGTIGSSMTQSSGIFTFPSTGLYFITVNQNYYDNDTDSRYFEFKIDGTVNNSSYTTQSRMTSSLKYISSNTYSMLTCNTFFNVTNTSNCKVRFKAESQNDTTIGGDTAFNESQSYTFIRLGDSV